MVKLQQDATFDDDKTMDINNDKWESLAWKKSLRPCVQDMIDTCPPQDYDTDDHVSKMCRSYQSVVIKPGEVVHIHFFRIVYRLMCFMLDSEFFN